MDVGAGIDERGNDRNLSVPDGAHKWECDVGAGVDSEAAFSEKHCNHLNATVDALCGEQLRIDAGARWVEPEPCDDQVNIHGLDSDPDQDVVFGLGNLALDCLAECDELLHKVPVPGLESVLDGFLDIELGHRATCLHLLQGTKVGHHDTK
jgi:hypothetical protein